MAAISNRIFLGTWIEARSRGYLKRNRISHIQCAAPELEEYFFNKDNFVYKTLPLVDCETFEIIPYLDSAADFIKQSHEDGIGLLIHDFKNDSRSTYCYIAYMIKHLNWKFSESLKYIIEKKPDAKLKKKFAIQVKIWEKELVLPQDSRKKRYIDNIFTANGLNKDIRKTKIQNLQNEKTSMNHQDDYDDFDLNQQDQINKVELGDIKANPNHNHFQRKENNRQQYFNDRRNDNQNYYNDKFKKKGESIKLDIDHNFIKNVYKKCIDNDPNYLTKNHMYEYNQPDGYNIDTEDKLPIGNGYSHRLKNNKMNSSMRLRSSDVNLFVKNNNKHDRGYHAGVTELLAPDFTKLHVPQSPGYLAKNDRFRYGNKSLNHASSGMETPVQNDMQTPERKQPHFSNGYMTQNGPLQWGSVRENTQKLNKICNVNNKSSEVIKGFAGMPTGMYLADVNWNKQPPNPPDDGTISQTSFSETFWKKMEISEDASDTISQGDSVFTQNSQNQSSQNFYNPSQLKSNRVIKARNPFRISSYDSGPILTKGDRRLNNKTRLVENFDPIWIKFCRGQLSGSSYQDCAKCGYVLCRQNDILIHSKHGGTTRGLGSKNGIDQNGFSVNSNNQRRIDNDPRDCDSVFVKKLDWIKFCSSENVNGSRANCPGCKSVVGSSKVSGMTCGCGHFCMPGYQIMKRCVRVKVQG